jgi:hypothetical protein
MIIFNLFKKYGILLVSLALLGSLFSFPAGAQTTPKIPTITLPTNPNFDLVISWRATNYVPANYQGKIMPSNNSSVVVSFDALDQGKFVDLSKQNIIWYLGDNFLQSGIGLKSVKFTVNQLNPVISISIPNYKDAKYSAGDIEGVITIPTTSAKVVIDAPYPAKAIKIGNNLFQALPYFFNISNLNQLNISWSVDGSDVSSQSGNASILNLTTATQGSPAVGANTSINVTAQNPASDFEFARGYINLDIK